MNFEDFIKKVYMYIDVLKYIQLEPTRKELIIRLLIDLLIKESENNNY